MSDDQQSTDPTAAAPSTDSPESFQSRRRWRMPAFVSSVVLGIVVALIAATREDPFHGDVDFDRVRVNFNRGQDGWRDVAVPADDAARLVDILRRCRVINSYRRGGRIQQFFNQFRTAVGFPAEAGTEVLVVPLQSGETVHIKIGHQDELIFGVRERAPKAGRAANPTDLFIEAFECDCGEPWDEVRTLFEKVRSENQ